MSSPAVMSTYARADLVFDRGEGAWLFTDGGDRFLDFGSGIAVTALGHAHPHLVKTLQDQAAKLWHVSNLYRIADQERLAERLSELSFADQVFFCNSGAEALECAIKTSRRFHQAQGADEKYRVITARGAFHGRTLATLAAGQQEKHLAGFAPMVDGFDQVPFGNLNEARMAIKDETAAVLVEPIQGEGGINPAAEDYLAGLRAMADEYGLLLIFDEVQCGMGRTGKLFAYEWSPVQPDVMALAKGLGGGFPVGACLATEQAAAYMQPGTHGSTFGGNPLAMATANAVLDVLTEDGFLDGVLAKAENLWAGLRQLCAEHPKVFTGVRGKGLMIGLECAVPNGDVMAAAYDQNLLTVVAGENVLRLLPPLVLTEDDIAAGLEKLAATAAALEVSHG